MSNRETERWAAMGDWLQGLVKWDVFATWTFARLITGNGAIYWAGRIMDRWEGLAGNKILGYWAVECGPVGGLLHLHALVGGVSNVKPYCGVKLDPGKYGLKCCLLHSWPCGYSRVFPYDPTKDAAYYVAKYVTKDLSEWGLYGNWEDKPLWAQAQTERRLLEHDKHHTKGILPLS